MKTHMYQDTYYRDFSMAFKCFAHTVQLPWFWIAVLEDTLKIYIKPVVPNLFWPKATFVSLEGVRGRKEIFKFSIYN